MLQVEKIHPYSFPGLDVTPELASVTDIISAVKHATGLEWDIIVSKSREMEIKDARHLLAYFLRVKTKLTWKKIGFIINRDHATAINGHKQVLNGKEYDSYFKSKVSCVNNYLYNSKF